MPGTDPNSMDAKLADIADHANQLHLSTVSAPTPGGSISGSLGYVSLTPGDGNGDWTIGAGPGSGDRKLTLATQEITTTASGTCLSVIAYDAVNGRIKHWWNVTSVVLNDATNYTVPEISTNDKAPVSI